MMVWCGGIGGWLTSLSISHLCILGKGWVRLLAYYIVEEFLERLFLLVWLGDDGRAVDGREAGGICVATFRSLLSSRCLNYCAIIRKTMIIPAGSHGNIDSLAAEDRFQVFR